MRNIQNRTNQQNIPTKYLREYHQQPTYRIYKLDLHENIISNLPTEHTYQIFMRISSATYTYRTYQPNIHESIKTIYTVYISASCYYCRDVCVIITPARNILINVLYRLTYESLGLFNYLFYPSLITNLSTLIKEFQLLGKSFVRLPMQWSRRTLQNIQTSANII